MILADKRKVSILCFVTLLDRLKQFIHFRLLFVLIISLTLVFALFSSYGISNSNIILGLPPNGSIDRAVQVGNSNSTGDLSMTKSISSFLLHADSNGPPVAEFYDPFIVENPWNADENISASQTGTEINLFGKDPDHDSLTFRINREPEHGRIKMSQIDNQMAKAYYTVEPGYQGIDVFQYSVSDGEAQSAPSTIFILVTRASCIGCKGMTDLLPPTSPGLEIYAQLDKDEIHIGDNIKLVVFVTDNNNFYEETVSEAQVRATLKDPVGKIIPLECNSETTDYLGHIRCPIKIEDGHKTGAYTVEANASKVFIDFLEKVSKSITFEVLN